jgi:hypothetical protein
MKILFVAARGALKNTLILRTITHIVCREDNHVCKDCVKDGLIRLVFYFSTFKWPSLNGQISLNFMFKKSF